MSIQIVFYVLMLFASASLITLAVLAVVLSNR